MTVADAVARELLKNPELEQFSKMVEEFGAGMKAVADSPAARGLAAWLKNFVKNGLPVAPSGAYVVTLNALPVAPSVEDIVDPVIPEAPRRRPGFAPWDS